MLAPAAYFFAGFLIVLAYNCAIVSVRFNFATAIPASPPSIAVSCVEVPFRIFALGSRSFPISFFRRLEFIYFGMFPQIGAAMYSPRSVRGKNSLDAIRRDNPDVLLLRACDLLLLAVSGPVLSLPGTLLAFSPRPSVVQHSEGLIPHAWRDGIIEPLARISTDYFIGLPCMHIMQPWS